MNIFGYELQETDVWLLRSAGALIIVLIGSIIYRTNIKSITKRKAHAEDILRCISPFSDAIANIHRGEHNHIFIMNSFFREQEEAIAIFQAKVLGKSTLKLKEAWNQYSQHYNLNAKGRIHGQFATIPEPFRTNELNSLHKHLSKIIKVVKRT